MKGDVCECRPTKAKNKRQKQKAKTKRQKIKFSQQVERYNLSDGSAALCYRGSLTNEFFTVSARPKEVDLRQLYLDGSSTKRLCPANNRAKLVGKHFSRWFSDKSR